MVDLLTYKTFTSFSQMPHNLFRSVRMMGYATGGSEFRELTRNLPGYTLVECHVAFIGDEPVGWAAVYTNPMPGEADYHAGVWVKHKFRHRGYGELLATKAYHDWFKKYNPEVFMFTSAVWDDLLIREIFDEHPLNK